MKQPSLISQLKKIKWIKIKPNSAPKFSLTSYLIAVRRFQDGCIFIGGGEYNTLTNTWLLNYDIEEDDTTNGFEVLYYAIPPVIRSYEDDRRYPLSSKIISGRKYVKDKRER